ncbi:DUF222 domain-containing protein [Pseudarthrobacter sp. NamB4]|nr:DUF222 domain-containing protein [Pseudarthrobacter sp. NamB4]
MDGIEASVAGLGALFAEDAALAAADGVAGGSVPAMDRLQRAYGIRLDRMAVMRRLEAQIAALKARDAAEAIGLQHAMTPPEAPVQERTFNEISTIEEIAGVLTVSSGAAAAFVTQARRLCSLPPAMAALAAGAMSWQHARILADETEGLNPAGAAALVAHILNQEAARGCPAGELVPSRFRAKVRSWRERHHPESIEKRHAKSVTDRRVEYSPDRDGMAWLSAYLPADTALGIWNKTTAIARGQQGPQETRTLTQLRADIIANTLSTAGHPGTHTGTKNGLDSGRLGKNGVGNDADQSHDVIGMAFLSTAANAAGLDDSCTRAGGSSPGTGRPGTTVSPEDAHHASAGPAARQRVSPPRADVLVTVPVFSLLGLTDEPATLDGYGPIPASMARTLVAGGAESFYRVLVDPRDGAPLEIGRTSYRLTKAMKQALRLRDGKCTFPGCSNHSPDNETDHLTAWHRGGTTGISNLAQLCPKHHRLKHHSRWTPTPATKNQPPGWTSPTGRHYKNEHHDWEPPQWPERPVPLEADPAKEGNAGKLPVQPSAPLQSGRTAASAAPVRHPSQR